MLVILFAGVATALAIIGLSLMPLGNAQEWSAVLGLLSVPWVISAIFMLIRSGSIWESAKKRFYERMIVVFAIVALLIAINSVTVLGVEPEMAMLYEIIALILLIGACISMYFSIRTSRSVSEDRERAALDGEISYVGQDSSRLLKSNRFGLSGRPDIILEMENELVPVEVKTGRQPKGPLFSHILQVAAYCLLLSEERGIRVSHGILRYKGVDHEIEYTEELEALLLSKLREMRRALETGEVHRNHHREGKCQNCSRRDICPERLV